MNSSERGFTLIEVMVALTLLGLIATILASGTRLSLDLSRRGNAKAEELRTEQLTRDILRGQLQAAMPFRYWTRSEKIRIEAIAFEGEPDHIRFVSRHGILDGPDSFPRWVELRRQTGDGKTTVSVEERRILSPDNQPDPTVTARADLLECSEVRFKYLDTFEKPQWKAAWSGTERTAPMPAAIRIECDSDRHSMKLLVPIDYAEAARQGFRLQ